MAEIIDILTLPIAKAQRFTVNTAVSNVSLVSPGGAVWNGLEGGAGNGQFLYGDSFSIIAAGLALPEGFTLYKDPAVTTTPIIPTRLLMRGITSGDNYEIDVLGFYQTINIPMENFELALDVFCNCINQQKTAAPHPLLNENFELITYPLDIKISMVGIPAAFNGKTFYISPFFKILHNFPLLAV